MGMTTATNILFIFLIFEGTLTEMGKTTVDQPPTNSDSYTSTFDFFHLRLQEQKLTSELFHKIYSGYSLLPSSFFSFSPSNAFLTFSVLRKIYTWLKITARSAFQHPIVSLLFKQQVHVSHFHHSQDNILVAQEFSAEDGEHSSEDEGEEGEVDGRRF